MPEDDEPNDAIFTSVSQILTGFRAIECLTTPAIDSMTDFANFDDVEFLGEVPTTTKHGIFATRICLIFKDSSPLQSQMTDLMKSAAGWKHTVRFWRSTSTS